MSAERDRARWTRAQSNRRIAGLPLPPTAVVLLLALVLTACTHSVAQPSTPDVTAPNEPVVATLTPTPTATATATPVATATPAATPTGTATIVPSPTPEATEPASHPLSPLVSTGAASVDAGAIVSPTMVLSDTGRLSSTMALSATHTLTGTSPLSATVVDKVALSVNVAISPSLTVSDVAHLATLLQQPLTATGELTGTVRVTTAGSLTATQHVTDAAALTGALAAPPLILVPTPQPPATPAPAPTPDGVARTVQVPILMYHHVSVPPADADVYRKDLSVAPELFAAHLDRMLAEGYTAISPYTLVDALTLGTPLPDKPVIITFDDGYRDNFEHAFPLLAERDMAGTFFVVTDFIDEERPEYLTWDMVRAMYAGGMFIESHGRNHVSLAGKDDDYLVWQALGSLETIQYELGVRPRFVSYPAGDYDQRTLDIFASADYWAGLTTRQGATQHSDDMFQLPRVRVRNTTTPDELIRLLELDW